VLTPALLHQSIPVITKPLLQVSRLKKSRTFKVGVIYAGEGQRTEDEMFRNCTPAIFPRDSKLPFGGFQY
jgi:hypothetical protein